MSFPSVQQWSVRDGPAPTYKLTMLHTTATWNEWLILHLLEESSGSHSKRLAISCYIRGRWQTYLVNYLLYRLLVRLDYVAFYQWHLFIREMTRGYTRRQHCHDVIFGTDEEPNESWSQLDFLVVELRTRVTVRFSVRSDTLLLLASRLLVYYDYYGIM